MNAFFEGLITIAMAIVGLAIIATLVSRNAQTAGVIQAASSGFANNLLAAQGSVSGARLAPDFSYGVNG